MGFQQGLSGLRASSTSLDVTSNNIANASTVGFKSAQAHFADMFAASLQTSSSNQIGIGVSVPDVAQQFTQGNISSTSNPLDMAINGDGFFGVIPSATVIGAASASGVTAATPSTYTRNGQFHLDKNGYIVDDAGRGLAGITAHEDPTTHAVTMIGQPIGPIKVEFQLGEARASTEGNIVANLDATKTGIDRTAVPFDQTDPTTYTNSTTTTIYDNLGVSHSLTYYFTKTTTANQWEMQYSLDGGTATALGTNLTFSNVTAVGPPATVAGKIDTTATTTPQTLTFTGLASGAGNINFDLDLSKLTQFGTAFSVTSTSQDGYEPGTLAGMNIGKDGVIQARYSNGQTKDVGQVMLYNFKNPNGLQSLGGNQWQSSSESGAASAPMAPGSGQVGALQSMSVEESNVDMTAELVNMIVQQRNYQANAQSIKTQDQIMQTLVNLR